jgi:hypothetical protein
MAHLDSGIDQNVKIGVFEAPGAKWSESGLTYANRPATSGDPIATGQVNDSGSSSYELDLTSFLKAQKAKGRQIVTLVIRALSTSPALVMINSKEASHGPELFIET